ncbi:helix-turn-helix transcriptional regulator [Phascolarctobacterium succinatutens]|uniref:helix-turn-helix transcriptional regulator n=1 Tax=Phascolarctobacterium succinatutens TaxID=626940 RepID=UPI0026EAED41|nr:WYL domain-containing protein [Phascolarctobacterium succinatutens]
MTDLRIAKDRLLYMYSRLVDGKMLYKKEEAQRFGCSLRSIQRDIEDLRSFLHEQNEATGIVQDLVYNQKLGAYQLVPPSRNLLSNEEVFATLKILLESRAFTKKELYPIIDKLIDCCIPKTEQQRVSELIGNEKLLYVEPQHKDKFLKKMWELSGAVREQQEVSITYRRTDSVQVQRTVQPVGIMFSEFYFYLIAFLTPKDKQKVKFEIENDPFPTIYRIDRIKGFTVTDKHFAVPYAKRFEEGEFRKRIQFMYGGHLQRLRFYFKGSCYEYILDRLPTAKVVLEDEKGTLIEAEVFGKGIDIWLKSQGELIEVVSRQELAVN